MVWHPANPKERAMAWALQSGDYARYFQAFTRAELFLPRRVEDDAAWPGEPVTTEVAGRTALPVFTSDVGLLTVFPEPEGIALVRYAELRDAWPSPEWLLAINPGLPIEAYLPVDLVEAGVRGELHPKLNPEVVMYPLGDGQWEPWPPGGAQQAVLDAVSHHDGAEYLDALYDCMVIVPTTRRVSPAEVNDLVEVRRHHPGPGPVDEATRRVLVELGVSPEAIDREFPWQLAVGRSEPTVEVFTQPEFRPYPEAPSVRLRFSAVLRLMPEGHALSVNPGGPANLELASGDVPLLRQWDGIQPVPGPVLMGMRWADVSSVRIVERRPRD